MNAKNSPDGGSAAVVVGVDVGGTVVLGTTAGVVAATAVIAVVEVGTDVVVDGGIVLAGTPAFA